MGNISIIGITGRGLPAEDNQSPMITTNRDIDVKQVSRHHLTGASSEMLHAICALIVYIKKKQCRKTEKFMVLS